MDTRLHGEHNRDRTVNDGSVPEKDCEGARRGRQDLEAGDRESAQDEQEQRANHDDAMVPRARSQPDSTVQPSRTLPLKRTLTSPSKGALKKRKSRLGTKDDKNYMPISEASRETAVGNLLTAGNSYSTPIDVEAVDMMMRNFPITEEHQVCPAGVVIP